MLKCSAPLSESVKLLCDLREHCPFLWNINAQWHAGQEHSTLCLEYECAIPMHMV